MTYVSFLLDVFIQSVPSLWNECVCVCVCVCVSVYIQYTFFSHMKKKTICTFYKFKQNFSEPLILKCFFLLCFPCLSTVNKISSAHIFNIKEESKSFYIPTSFMKSKPVFEKTFIACWAKINAFNKIHIWKVKSCSAVIIRA